MNIEQLLGKLERSRERVLLALEPLPDEALLQPGAVGEWSLKDLLVHLTLWESELVTALMKIDQGKRPSNFIQALDNVERYNAEQQARFEGRDLGLVFDDYHRVRVNLEQWLPEFSERALHDPRRYKWSPGRSLAQLIEESSFGHEEEHLPEIEAFAARWLADEAQREQGSDNDDSN